MASKRTIYKSQFFKKYKDGSFRSAKIVIPIIFNLIQIKSVVDVGCGAGVWLKAFQEEGIEDVFGIDGNSTEVQDLSSNKFLIVDLGQEFKLDRRFDLAISLEVAEHLMPANADDFVLNLTSLAPIVLFSAAVPCQGGTHHVNEQWPDYWAEKFLKRGFLAFDVLRMRLWNEPEVEWWYKQNLILYIHRDFIPRIPSISNLSSVEKPPKLFHPDGIRIKIIFKIALKQLKKRLGLAKKGWSN